LILRAERQEGPDQAHEGSGAAAQQESENHTARGVSRTSWFSRRGTDGDPSRHSPHDRPTLSSSDPSVCSILHIFVGKEETKVGGGSELIRLALWSRWVFSVEEYDLSGTRLRRSYQKFWLITGNWESACGRGLMHQSKTNFGTTADVKGNEIPKGTRWRVESG
jgi:hypothetical protein